MADLELVASSCAAFNLRRASRMVTRRFEQALRPVNLSSFQFTALVAISKAGSLPQTRLADAMGMDVSTLTRNLKPLIHRQLVVRNAHKEDGRVKLISITDEGKSVLKTALPLWEKAQAATLKDLSSAEWATLKEAIRALA
ncbi:MAG: MarR family transcriptional regulator [Pseudomonadota bacterium]